MNEQNEEQNEKKKRYRPSQPPPGVMLSLPQVAPCSQEPSPRSAPVSLGGPIGTPHSSPLPQALFQTPQGSCLPLTLLLTAVHPPPVLYGSSLSIPASSFLSPEVPLPIAQLFFPPKRGTANLSGAFNSPWHPVTNHRSPSQPHSSRPVVSVETCLMGTEPRQHPHHHHHSPFIQTDTYTHDHSNIHADIQTHK